MSLLHWFHRDKRRSSRNGRPPRASRPRVERLEDRTVLSHFGRSFFPLLGGGPGAGSFGWGFPSQPGSTSGPATHLAVIVPENVTSGSSTDVIVEALDASNHLATGYTGTVSLTSSDPSATLPANYTFTAADHGIHVFQVTLATTGSQTVTATDTTTSSLTGSATTTVNPAPVATHLLVLTPEQTTAGVPTEVTVVALDAAGHRVPNYTGTVSFTSSDPSATLPASYTFTAADHGVHTFPVTFQTTGPQTVTVTDTSNSSITGQGATTVSEAGTVTHFGIFPLGPALAGSPTQVLVVALDASNQVVPGYTGTVHFTSSDSAATLPADYTFTASDHGSHMFTVTFATPGRQTLTATDTSTNSITGSASERVFSDLVEQIPFGERWTGRW